MIHKLLKIENMYNDTCQFIQLKYERMLKIEALTIYHKNYMNIVKYKANDYEFSYQLYNNLTFSLAYINHACLKHV